MLQFLYRQFTIALHALVGEPVQDGAALVAHGGARSVGVLHPGVGRPGLHTTNTNSGQYRCCNNPQMANYVGL